MATDGTRNDVWQAILDAARLVRYYEALADRHRRRHQAVRFMLLIAAAAGVATVLDLLPDLGQALAGGLVAVLVAWDFVADYAKKAALLHTISLECSALESDWRELWHEVNDWKADDAAIRDAMRALNRRTLEATGRAGTADIREDERLNQKCAESAYKVVADRYAV